MNAKESLEPMEVEFILTVKSTCFFKNRHFYVDSVAPIFKMEVQSQVPINKDKMIILFFRLRTCKTCVICLVKKLYKTADMVKYIFAWPVESVAPF